MARKAARRRGKRGTDIALTLAESLRELAHRVARFEKLSQSEQDMMKRLGNQLTFAVEKLTRIMVQHPNMTVVADRLLELRTALAIAFWIGNHAVKNPINERLGQEIKRASAARARQVRQSESEKLDDAIVQFAQLHWKKNGAARQSAGATAAAIAEPVNRGRAKPLSVNAIEKRVRKHMKSRTAGQSSD